MATETTQLTSPLQVRSVTTIIASGLISAAVAGSIIMTGNSYTDRNQNTAPTLSLGTGAYMTYKDSVCTNTGGLATYVSCNVTNPFTGTAAIILAQVDSNKAPTASRITCRTYTQYNTTGTGIALFKYASTFSGSSVGSFTGTTLTPYARPIVLPSGGVSCWHSTTPGVGLKEQLRVWFNQQYAP